MSETTTNSLSWKQDFAFSKPSTFPLKHRLWVLGGVIMVTLLVFMFAPFGELKGMYFLFGLLAVAFVTLVLMLENILFNIGLNCSSAIIDTRGSLERTRLRLNRGLQNLTEAQLKEFGRSYLVLSRTVRAWAFVFYTLIVLTGGGAIGLGIRLWLKH